MHAPLTPVELRKQICVVIQRKFEKLVSEVKRGNDSLANVAAQVGATRQALDQNAAGSVPSADLFLMAVLKWDWVIRVENPGGSPAWFEFSLSDMEGGLPKRKRDPVQLPLFEALTDLDENLDTLKKSVGRVEAEIERAFQRRA